MIVILVRDLVILSIGEAMNSVLPHLLGSQIDDLFHMDRPIIDFTWDSVSLLN